MRVIRTTAGHWRIALANGEVGIGLYPEIAQVRFDVRETRKHHPQSMPGVDGSIYSNLTLDEARAIRDALAACIAEFEDRTTVPPPFDGVLPQPAAIPPFDIEPL